MQDSHSVSSASKPLTSQLPCRGAGLPTSHVMEQFLGLFCPWLVPVISNLGVTSEPGLAPELPSGTVSSPHALIPITRSTPGISGHTGVAVTAVLATQFGVSSWLWSGGIRAGRCSAAPTEVNLHFQPPDGMGCNETGQDRMDFSSLPHLPSQGGPACPHSNVPHISRPSHSSLLLAAE